ncbi:MAG: cytochrome c3 family protein [Desulfobacterales bacterium]|nr:cytochrome c3 family protein [Desulfobacterales bacterium]
MTSKKELKIAFSMAILLFIVGVFCYSAFSSTKPAQPVRLMFKCVAGNVLFDHATHAEEKGKYDASCDDCHHEESDDADNQTCGECHKREGTEDVETKRSDAFHGQCIECHKEKELGPVECSKCHVM